MIKLRRNRTRGPETDGVIAGTARVDERTKNLLARIQPEEIAVIDHEDLDRVAAEGLVQRQVRAVVNVARSTTGRYPNLGPLLLCSAGIHLVDEAGPEVMAIPDGTRVSIDGNEIWVVEGSLQRIVGKGHVLTLGEVEEKLDRAKQSVAVELERFARNTMDYMKDEHHLLLETGRLPQIKTDMTGRHVLVVVRGSAYKEDLKALRAYIREMRPLLIGVDGGADALIDFGLRPDMIIGDMDSVTTEALLSGAELVVHAYPGGEAPGLERIEALGLESVVFEAAGTSEDIAMLLAYEHRAELIVAVGTHSNLVEFLDKGRKGMASTFLTRLRVGPMLVDARGVSKLYQSRIRRRDLFLLIGSALLILAIVMALSPPVRLELKIWWVELKDLWFRIREALF